MKIKISCRVNQLVGRSKKIENENDSLTRSEVDGLLVDNAMINRRLFTRLTRETKVLPEKLKEQHLTCFRKLLTQTQKLEHES